MPLTTSATRLTRSGQKAGSRRTFPRLGGLAAGFLVLSLLSGCGMSRPTDFYMLTGDAPALGSVKLPGTSLALGGMVIPGYLDRPGIVVRDANGPGLNVPQFNVWAEPLPQGLRRVLAAQLLKPLLDIGVSTLPASGDRTDTDYAVHMEILRLDADSDGRVVFAVRWALQDRVNHVLLARGNHAAEEQISLPAFGTSEMFDAIVAAESRLVQHFGSELAREVVAALTKQPRAGRMVDR